MLSDELTPSLEDIDLVNIGNDCELNVEVTSLKNIKLRYWGGNPGPVSGMPRFATDLKSFSSYKLCMNSISFESDSLKELSFRCSEVLQTVVTWAPNLEKLLMMNCSLEFVIIYTWHPSLHEELPDSHAPSSFLMNISNCSLSKAVMFKLNRNPRILFANNEEFNPSYSNIYLDNDYSSADNY